MKHLIILTGLSCTLKDSIADYLVQRYQVVKFPDVNRQLIKTLTGIVSNKEVVDTTNKIPNLLLCSNRLQVYNSFLNGVESVSSLDTTKIFVCQRTVLEHLFFGNSELLTSIDKEKLIKTENEFLSRFDRVSLVLIENHNDEMLKKFYITDKIRSAITIDNDKITSYHKLQAPYERFISQLRKIDLKFGIPEGKCDSCFLTALTKSIAETIISKIL